MKNLGNLSPQEGAHKLAKRKGRGPGSGNGKTAGKGHKGQKARKGSSVPAGFEGGQTPLYRRLPKYGFSNAAFARKFHCINIEKLSVFADGDVVDAKSLVEKGLLKDDKLPVKLLGRGTCSKKLTVRLHKISAGAQEIVKNAGGTLEEI